MNLSFSTLGCPEWGFKDIISTAKDMGYNGIEVRGIKNVIDVPRIPEFAPDKVADTKEYLAKKAVDIVCLTSGCYMNVPAKTGDTMYQAKSYVDVAKDLGVKYIRVLGDFGPAPDKEIDENVVVSNVKEISEYAKKAGVMVLVETNGYYAESAKMADLLEKVGDNVGVIWDIHHPFRYFNESPKYTVKMLGERIKHVHIKDSVLENGSLKYKMVGYGDVPIAACVEALEEIGYAGSYCLEWVRRWDMDLEEAGIAFAQYAGYMKYIK